MNKFLTKISFFVFIFMLINIFLYFFAFNNYYSTYKKNIPIEYYKKFDTFIFSDSRGDVLKDLPESKGVYNFSHPSDNYKDMFNKLIYLIDNDVQISKIYLSYEIYHLYSYRDMINNNELSFLNYSSDNFLNINEKISKYFKYYFPVFNDKVTSILKLYITNKFSFNADDGENKEVWSEMRSDLRSKIAFKRFDKIHKKQREVYELKQQLKNIIKLCKENNIELFLIKFPVSSEYYSFLSNLNTDNFRFAEKNNLFFRDFSSIYIDKKNYFKDADHLNELGSIDFLNVLLE